MSASGLSLPIQTSITPRRRPSASNPQTPVAPSNGNKFTFFLNIFDCVCIFTRMKVLDAFVVYSILATGRSSILSFFSVFLHFYSNRLHHFCFLDIQSVNH